MVTVVQVYYKWTKILLHCSVAYKLQSSNPNGRFLLSMALRQSQGLYSSEAADVKLKV